ncbi:MAG: radical SAM protein, partial [Oscillospiraceae bacterium]|nr:radical SAM protein [Oscillospiraceae bacterium]
MIRISWYTVTTDLGSGKRFALWVQGCKKRCRGCIAPSLRDMDGGELMDEEELIQAIVSSDAEGITISGGEPFLQSAALVHILDGVRRRRDMGVICYTGMRYEDIADDPLIGHIDLLIDGEYIE